MITVIIICSIVLTIAITAALVYLIQTLYQMKRTAREAEVLLKNINQEVAAIGQITGTISAFVEKFSSPWVRVGSWFTGFLANYYSSRRNRNNPSGREK
jgi:hypothetical protein